MKRLVFAVLGLSLFAAAPARADTEVRPADRADVQCLAILLAVAGSNPDMDAEAQAGVAAGAMFYLGRLNGRSPERDWLEYLTSYLESSPEQDFKTEHQRCGEEMGRFGAEMIQWGEAVQKQFGAQAPKL